MSEILKEASSYDETTPVLIVGGSLVGLSTALFLGWHGIPALLVERHPGISPFPRAAGFNPRTLEFFSTVGAEPAIRQAEPADMQNRSIVRMETLAGNELDRYVQNLSDFTSEFSPIRGSVITQDLMEPVLREQARQLGSDLRFNTELVSFEQDSEGVSAVIRDRASGEERAVRARYLVAADGNGSPTRNQLGIGVQGPGTLANIVNMMFRADLRAALRGRRILVGYIMRTQGVFGGDEDGGLMTASYFPEKGEKVEDFAGARGVEVIRAAVGIPDLAVEIRDVLPWKMAVSVAERFQQGRVFLVGDSAHVMPPTGGFGANTGIADAYDLAWKLAFVITGQAGPGLLATYDIERRPVAQFTVDQAFALSLERMPQRAPAQHTTPKLDVNTIVFGYRYSSTAVLSAIEESKLYDDPYHPGGQPGARAPHVILERKGERISTINLFGRTFVLLAGEDGNSWCEAARQAAKRLNLSMDAYRIGKSGDMLDVADRFLQDYELSPTGAVLVRPDGFIGWRAGEGEVASEQALEQVLSRLLSR